MLCFSFFSDPRGRSRVLIWAFIHEGTKEHGKTKKIKNKPCRQDEDRSVLPRSRSRGWNPASATESGGLYRGTLTPPPCLRLFGATRLRGIKSALHSIYRLADLTLHKALNGSPCWAASAHRRARPNLHGPRCQHISLAAISSWTQGGGRRLQTSPFLKLLGTAAQSSRSLSLQTQRQTHIDSNRTQSPGNGRCLCFFGGALF